ncbi:hypothetical protein HF086_003304 [Spodoptera exigua]|uniref:tRNA pseudouridine(55) synthase n=1 Tax=Spodoptera exigua TaxID=7107 RepID=A0A922SQG8_SPOEX|nr:hypothetical protein HF086_003304 [Spodoptera exigua]
MVVRGSVGEACWQDTGLGRRGSAADHSAYGIPGRAAGAGGAEGVGAGAVRGAARGRPPLRRGVHAARRRAGAGGRHVRRAGRRRRAGRPPPAARAACVSVACAHAPLYLAGRYVKLSRSLPQTPWLVNGRRMMHSSVQEIIFEPIAALYRLSPEDVEHRLKFMSAGREDVDVRCLGEGRPFAIEVTDPTRQPSEAELKELCEQISAGGQVVVRSLVPISR